MSGKVSIVVLNYRNSGDTEECLASLLAISYADREIIVVDNASQDGSLDALARFLAERKVPHARLEASACEAGQPFSERVFLVQSPTNGGYAAGNNVGIRLALARGTDYVLILNNDTTVREDFLAPLVAFAERRDDVAMVGPKVLNMEGGIDRGCARRRSSFIEYVFRGSVIGRLFKNNWAVRRHFYMGEYGFDQPKEVDLISGCCMLIKRSVFQRIGLLDEKTFLNLEEFILHEKLRGAGLLTYVVPDSVIVHKHGRSIRKAPSAFVTRVSRESFRYYLTQYRHFRPWMVAILMVRLPAVPEWLRLGRKSDA